MNKKGDLSIQVIIIAAIALIVLVVLVVIFAGKSKNFSEGTTSTSEGVNARICGAAGGICRAQDSAVACNEYQPGTNWIDCTSTQRCCK